MRCYLWYTLDFAKNTKHIAGFYLAEHFNMFKKWAIRAKRDF